MWRPKTVRTELFDEKNLEVAIFNHRCKDYRRRVLLAMLEVDYVVLKIMENIIKQDDTKT